MIEWIKTLEKIGPETRGISLFPPHFSIGGWMLNRSITVQRFDQILQRLDPTLTSHMFRYGASEKLLKMGYTPWELKEIGDWASSRMPEEYAKRKGLTESQRQYAEDLREI